MFYPKPRQPRHSRGRMGIEWNWFVQLMPESAYGTGFAKASRSKFVKDERLNTKIADSRFMCSGVRNCDPESQIQCQRTGAWNMWTCLRRFRQRTSELPEPEPAFHSKDHQVNSTSVWCFMVGLWDLYGNLWKLHLSVWKTWALVNTRKAHRFYLVILRGARGFPETI